MQEIEIKEISQEHTWPIRHKVMWPDKPFEYVKLEEDAKGRHLGLFAAGRLVSIVSVFVSDGEAQFRKFATLEEEQGRGYGSRLLRYLMQELAGMQLNRIWCNARLDKVYFYERFGMQPTEERFSKGGIDYVIMEGRA